MKLAFALLAFALASFAAGLDGDWNAQLTTRGKNAQADENQTFTLSLKTNKDGKVSGMVTLAGKKKPRLMNIQNAKLDGNTLTFMTQQSGKKGTGAAFLWQVKVDGDQMTGTRTRDGVKRGQAFQAHRAG